MGLSGPLLVLPLPRPNLFPSGPPTNYTPSSIARPLPIATPLYPNHTPASPHLPVTRPCVGFLLSPLPWPECLLGRARGPSCPPSLSGPSLFPSSGRRAKLSSPHRSRWKWDGEVDPQARQPPLPCGSQPALARVEGAPTLPSRPRGPLCPEG